MWVFQPIMFFAPKITVFSGTEILRISKKQNKIFLRTGCEIRISWHSYECSRLHTLISYSLSHSFFASKEHLDYWKIQVATFVIIRSITYQISIEMKLSYNYLVCKAYGENISLAETSFKIVVKFVWFSPWNKFIFLNNPFILMFIIYLFISKMFSDFRLQTLSNSTSIIGMHWGLS